MKAMEATCPQCKMYAGNKNAVRLYFGIRMMNGKEKPQSYCKVCRVESNKETTRVRELNKKLKLKGLKPITRTK